MKNQTNQTNNTIWHKIAEKEPPDDSLYIVYAASADPASPLITTAWWNPQTRAWSLVPYWSSAITHWTFLPEPPDSNLFDFPDVVE